MLSAVLVKVKAAREWALWLNAVGFEDKERCRWS